MTMQKTVAAKTGEKWWETKAAKSAPVKKATKSIQTITFNTSSFNDEERTFIAIASTPIADRYGDVVDQSGWELENFLNNPVVPWAHNYYEPPVARAVEIGINEQGNLQFKYQAPPEGLYPFADTIWNLYRNQFMFAFSVGFNASEYENVDDDDGYNSGWPAYKFTKCELLEISAVVVPANPQAVALAFDKGLLGDVNQLKDFKGQIASAMKSIDKLIKRSEGEEKPVAEKQEEAAKADVNADENAQEATKPVENADATAKDENEVEKPENPTEDAEGLTSNDPVEDTDDMSTKAGVFTEEDRELLKSVKTMLEELKTASEAQVTKGVADSDKVDLDKEDTAEENKDNQTGEDTAKGDGTNASTGDVDQGDAEKLEGDKPEVAADAAGDELIDPDDMTPEQAKKVADLVNEELAKLESN